MAYIPPHKRHSKILEKSSPTPELLATPFKRFNPKKSNMERIGKILYANTAISSWFMVGSTEADEFPASVHLEPISWETFEQRTGGKPLALINSHLMKEQSSDPRGIILRRPWASVSGRVLQDLLSQFEIVKNEMNFHELEVEKPTLVARFGKVLFHGSPSVSLESIKEIEVAEATLRQFRRAFYTNVPTSDMENIVDVVAPEIGVDFEDEKEIYHLKLSDSTRQDTIIRCKCSVTKDKRLELYKVKLDPVRHMVIDVSCLEKNLDLRLMLCAKRALTSLTDDEKCSIRELIDSAVLDTNVRGGLRWPLGKESSGNRYSIIAIWHTITKVYSSPSFGLKVRRADRFDLRTSTGEVTNEIVLKLKGIVSELQTSVAFTSLVIAAVPMLYAMGKAATSLSKLADTACEELPSTMAAIRLSGMEVSDLTLELSDLSQEIADGIDKSAQVVQSAEAGIRQIGTLSRQETLSMIQERACLPIISLQPVVAGAARMTSRAVGDATKTFMNIISRGEFSSENEDNNVDGLDI